MEDQQSSAVRKRFCPDALTQILIFQ